jgi:translation initiation factor IF-2
MRVYEFAKRVGLPNKEILELLNAGGFTLASHMSVINEQALVYLEKKLAKQAVKQAAPVGDKAVEKKVAATKAEQQPIQKVSEKMPDTQIKPQQKASVQPVVKEVPVQKVAPFPAHARPVPTPVVRSPVIPQRQGPAAPIKPTTIEVRSMTVDELAQKMHKSVSEVILGLLKKGVRATKNQLLEERVIADLARSFEIEPLFPTKKEAAPTIEKRVASAVTESQIDRLPVIVVMGHVDHGKTTLLDHIRKTRVAAREKGGITQHLGAYEVKTSHGNIVFLDTPGHQAFPHMRIRGTKAADIAVLVVAADDSVMPQTVEAIKIARAAELPIVVAVNKIDKAAPERVDVVKRECAQYELLPEEWGGSTIFVPISAKTGAGVDSLLEILALQSQMMELKADPTVPARGFILESKVEKGRGPVATVICQEGTVKQGDYFVAGAVSGKITAMVDSFGNRVNTVAPSHPVQISGFDDLAGIGEPFEVVSEVEYRKVRSQLGARVVTKSKQVAKENAINIIVKTEGAASLEAVLGGLRNLPEKEDKELYVITSGVGGITEGDVMLAGTTGALIIGLHVKPEANAALLAQRSEVKIRTFEIIYQLFDALKDEIRGVKEVVKIKQKIGEAEVRKVFAIKGVGVIAGCYMKEGRITNNSTVVVWRGREKIGEGKIDSLQRDRKTVKEVHQNFECAFMIAGFENWEVGDRAEVYLEVPKPTV